MLVLSRKSQEKIQIGDQITISVLAVKGNVVRIGIEAPTNIHIVRGELPPLEQPREEGGSNASMDAPTERASGARATAAGAAATRLCREGLKRPPSLQSRLHRRLEALKGEVFRPSPTADGEESIVHCWRATTT